MSQGECDGSIVDALLFQTSQVQWLGEMPSPVSVCCSAMGIDVLVTGPCTLLCQSLFSPVTLQS